MTLASPPSVPSVLEPSGSHPPEVLAVDDVVTTLGFFPARSLALRIRRRRRPFAVLRVDLPPVPPNVAGSTDGSRPDEGALRVTGILTGLLSKLTGVAGVDLLVFGDPPDGPRSPERERRAGILSSGDDPDRLLDLLAVRLDDAGFSIGLLIAVDGGAATRRMPNGRRSAPAALTRQTLSRSVHTPLPSFSRCEAGGAPVARDDPAGVVADGVAADTSRTSVAADESDGRRGVAEDLHHGRFVPLSPIPEERRTAAMAALGLQPGHGPADAPDDPLLALQSWVTALHDSGVPSETRSIALAWPLRRTVVRDLVLMLAAWGVEAAIGALHETVESGPEDGRPVFTAFLGAGERAPDGAGLRHSVEVLRRVAECAPVSLAPAPLAMLAWLEWSRGRGTVAAAYLDECQRADPAYTLGLLFRQVLDQGWVPDWID
jgi:hypothetical protein